MDCFHTLLVILLPFVALATEYDGREQGLTTWPTDIPTDVENIRLDRNDLTAIPVAALEGFTSLTNFQAKRNDIFQSQTESALIVPETLQTMDLAHNLLVSLRLELAPSAHNVSSMIGLDLTYNKITSFPEISEHIAKSLRFLFLYCNKLSLITSAQLSPFTSLETLNLNNNTITQDDSAVPLIIHTPLKDLFLDDNDLTQFHLQLSNNVEGDPSLTRLSVRNNQLMTFPVIDNLIARSVSILGLNGNYLTFDPFF